MRRFNPEKELKKIQKGNKNKILYGIILLLLIISIGSTYALYQVRYSKRIIYTKVAPFSNKDIQLAVFLDDNPTDDFPEKNSGYKYDHIECDNDSTAKFDPGTWQVILRAGTKDKCNVYFVKEEEGVPNVPELYQGLIPVVYDASGNISVADTTTDWYNYDEKRWANAVLVDSSNYSKYVDVNTGEYLSKNTIPMSEVLQMYVWIPRYKYKLFNVNYEGVEEQEIKIQFEIGTSNTGDIECKYTNNNDGTITEKCVQKGTEIPVQNGDWYTHPAFTFKGTFEDSGTELSGIWVGKFEASHTTKSNLSDNSAVLNCTTTNCSEADYIRMIPNVPSLRYNSVSNYFYVSRSIEKANNIYSLDSSQIDTHMMKNMEWGAMAYLTHSRYGRCTDGSCVEVTINGNNNWLIGYANTGSTWETAEGQKASTTGNIYGIYDTNGGTHEDVMGNIFDSKGKFYPAGSEFTTVPDSQYFDAYERDSVTTSSRRGHLGDATREIVKILGEGAGSWYGDYSSFPEVYHAWFYRGGRAANEDGAGTFNFYRYDRGGASFGVTFRLVISLPNR